MAYPAAAVGRDHDGIYSDVGDAASEILSLCKDGTLSVTVHQARAWQERLIKEGNNLLQLAAAFEELVPALRGTVTAAGSASPLVPGDWEVVEDVADTSAADLGGREALEATAATQTVAGTYTAEVEPADDREHPVMDEEHVLCLTHTLGREIARLLRHGAVHGRREPIQRGPYGELSAIAIARILNTPLGLILAVAQKDTKGGRDRFTIWQYHGTTFIKANWGTGRQRRRGERA